jgi:dipeptidase
MGSNCIDCREPAQPFNKGLGWPEIGQIVLQRCKTAREAVELCGKLVDQYSFNGFEATSCKNLTFLIADSDEGWFMEVTKRHWVAKRCPDDGAVFYANQALIETDWDMASADLIPYAVANGWFDPASGEKFNFREVYGLDLGKPVNAMREERAKELLGLKLGSITAQDLINVMKDHYEGKPYYDTPHSQRKARSICVSGTQSTQLYHLRKNMPAEIGCVMWSLASSPCLGVYVPIWAGYGGDIPAEWQKGSDSFSPDSAWWTFENIQRIVAPKDNPDPDFWKITYPVIRERWDKIEKKGWEQATALEKEATALWQQGKKDEVRKLLTNYTNTRLHSDFLEAHSILESLTAKGRKPGRE